MKIVKFLWKRERKIHLKARIMSGEKGSSKVRAFMGQTPKNLKQKFFSVLGTSSEYKKQFISGISNKVGCGVNGSLIYKLSILLFVT